MNAPSKSGIQSSVLLVVRQKMRVLISGASGLVGTELQKQLIDQGHTPVVLVRGAVTKPNQVFWNPSTHEIDHKV